MFQQIIAIIIIIYFLTRLILQKKKKRISPNEFLLWLIFWLVSLVLVVFIKLIDDLVASLGFSGSGIQVLLYLGVAIMFYLIFRLRLKIEKMDKNITDIVRKIAIDKTGDNIEIKK